MKKEVATFAGGCFWCLEEAFSDIEGVIEVLSGYSGGDVEYPTYEEVCEGKTGHREAIQVIYDSDIVSYEELLEFFGQTLTQQTHTDNSQTKENNIKQQYFTIQKTKKT